MGKFESAPKSDGGTCTMIGETSDFVSFCDQYLISLNLSKWKKNFKKDVLSFDSRPSQNKQWFQNTQNKTHSMLAMQNNNSLFYWNIAPW